MDSNNFGELDPFGWSNGVVEAVRAHRLSELGADEVARKNADLDRILEEAQLPTK